MASSLEQYRAKLSEYLRNIQTLDDLKKEPKVGSMVTLTFDILRHAVENPVDGMSMELLLRHGSKALGACGYLNTEAARTNAQSKLAKTAYEQVWNNTFLIHRASGKGVTDARLAADSDCESAEVETIIEEQKAKTMEAVASAANSLVIFIEVALKHLGYEQAQQSSRLHDIV